MPIVRVSILRTSADKFAKVSQMMDAAREKLLGINDLPGLLAYYVGADEATLALTNTSLWDTLEHAHQLDTYQPMLDLAKIFTAEGVQFERPIMNFTTMWTLKV